MSKKKKPSNATLAWARDMLAFAARYNDTPQMRHFRVRGDANESMALALQLEHMMSKVYSVEYPSYKAQSLFTTTHEGSGSTSIARRHAEAAGDMKEISGNSVTDLPTIAHFSTKEARLVTFLGGKIEWSIFDLARAAVIGEPLSGTLMNTAREIFERGVDRIAAFGSGTYTGVLNDADVSIEALSAAGVWASDANKMVADVNKLVLGYANANEGLANELPDTLILPPSSLIQLSQNRLSNLSMTGLQAVMESNPSLTRIESWDRCTAAGASSAKRAVVLHSSSVELNVPDQFQPIAPQAKGLGFEQPCFGSTDGVYVSAPVKLRYMDGF